MNHDWKDYWIKQARASISDPLQSQVLRTINKQPIADAEFQGILHDIEDKLAPGKNDTLLDLCCGNGLITTYLSPRCRQIIAVDLAEEFTRQMDLSKFPNITPLVGDVREVQFEDASFDRILMYAGIQYLTYKETINLFESAHDWLKKGGTFLIGDVPDQMRLWNFSNTPERQAAYFNAIKNDSPAIGTWFEPQWLINLGRYAGFDKAEALSLPGTLPFSAYRFDLLLAK